MKLWSMIAACASAAALITAAPASAEPHAGDSTMTDKMADKTVMADIVDTAVAAGSFNTLVAAVQAADLEATLRGDGPFTVFAPTDEAFAALGQDKINDLLKPENKETLAAILTYHVVVGEKKSGDLIGQTLSVATANGAAVAIDATDGVKVGGANVTQADIHTTNGVIHAIDTVLVPPSAE